MTWQTIASAPKDGRPILVCDARVVGGHICAVAWDAASSAWLTVSSTLYWHDKFTHWHAIPALPPLELRSESPFSHGPSH